MTLKLDGDDKGFKELAKDAEGLKKVLASTVIEAQQLNSGAINFAAIATGISKMQDSMGNLRDVLTELTAGCNYAIEAETKLTTVMEQRMNATSKEIESIKELALAQREKGVIDDDAQLMGAQQIATFLNEAKSIETLLPAMNNLLAQQKGYNATGQDAVAIGNLMGKVMQGQVSALTRVGITFTEAEEKVLKYGTESERAAMLAQVITNNVGEMNAKLGATDIGKQVQLEAKLGDIQDVLGELVSGALPFVNMAAEATKALASITTLTAGIKASVTAIKSFRAPINTASALTMLMGVNAKKSAAVMRVFSSAMTTGAHSATALKLAVRGLLISTGIGVAIAGVATAINAFSDAADKAAEKERELADEFKAFKKEIRDVGQATGENAQKEIAALDKLYNIAKDETKSKKERTTAIKEMQGLYPAYFSALSSETIDVKKLTTGYDNLRDSILQTARARAAESKIEENTGRLIDVEQQIKAKQEQVAQLEKAYGEAERNYNKARTDYNNEVNNRSWFVSAAMAGEKVQPITPSQLSMQDAAGSLTKYRNQLKAAQGELATLVNRQTELNAANQELADIVKNTPAIKVTGNTGNETEIKTPSVVNENAKTLREITDNIRILNDELQDASTDEVALINQQIAGWQAKADAITNAGKAAEDNTPLWKEDADTLKEIGDNIDILNAKLQNATADEAVLINQQIASWNAKADAIRNAGKAANNTPLWKEDAATLKDIGDNIEILTDKLQTATVEEAALINQQIKAWNDKADAIRNAGKEAEKTAITTGQALKDGWGGIKNIGSSIEGITESLKGNGSAWQTVVGVVDGFLGLYEGFQTIIGVIELLTGVSTVHTAAKGAEAVAETTAASARAGAAVSDGIASGAVVAANKLETASWKQLAAAKYMAAHASIPFAGFGIGAGFVAAMEGVIAAVGNIPALAEGGIASGPTLALVGEYPGASGNPEVIAPLNKLREMLDDSRESEFGRVEFRIKGRTLSGILEKVTDVTKRS